MVEFDELTHTYTFAGKVLPSVTQILKPWSGLDFVNRELLEMAAEFGTHVHTACHLLNTGELDRDSVTGEVEAYLAGWERFVRESGFVVTSSEERVYHQKLGFAGTLDVMGLFPDREQTVLIDIKTGATVPKTVGPQTAAYCMARGPRLQRYCCTLSAGAYNLTPLRDIKDYDRFRSALALYQWQPLPNQGPEK